MKKQGRSNRKRLGFTLAELLMVVAILVVLFALAIPGLFYLQKSLRQTSLDRKAETIYTAVQNRLAELYGNGDTSSYNPTLHADSLLESTVIPGDFDATLSGNVLDANNHVYYFMNGSDVANTIIGDDTISEELKKGYFVVEIVPYAHDDESNQSKKQMTAGMVYAVYYSEDADWNVQEQYNGGKEPYRTTYRSRDKRMSETNAHVGYYGGSSPGSTSSSKSLSVSSVEIKSDEEVNTAIIKAKKPTGISDNATFTFTLTDTKNNSRTIIAQEISDGKFKYEVEAGTTTLAASANDLHLTAEKVGVNYTFTLTIDDLSNENSRFDALYGAKSKTLHPGYTTTLISGSDIKLAVSVSCDNDLISSGNGIAYGNSLFDYGYEDNDSTGYEEHVKKQTDTATITTARHLQNLDTSSAVVSNITTANVKNDISFNDDSAFDEAYSSSYFNGLTNITKINSNGSTSTEQVANFKSISNKNITTITSTKVNADTNKVENAVISNLTSNSANANVGLFQDNNSSGLTIRNFTLVGTRLNGANVGGLVGVNNASLTIQNTYLYLSSTNSDIPATISASSDLERYRWLTGNVVGGLVGTNNASLSITESSASTVLGKASGVTGGLLGSNNGVATINQSYADSYYYGKYIGGLVGTTSASSTLQINNAYTAGFIALDDDSNASAAGLVDGNVSTANSVYTIMVYKTVDSDGGITTSNERGEGKFYTTAQSIASASNIYYYNNMSDGTNVNASSIENMSGTFGSGYFTTNNPVTPFNLMGQALTTYEYPTLTNVSHYGDWDVDFIPGSLTYFEEYSNGRFGFYSDGLNTLDTSDNYDLVGDGYAIIYKEKPTNDVKYKLNNGSTVTLSVESGIEVTDITGEKYWIYKLNLSDVNPSTNLSTTYYSTIEVIANTSKTYNFYPHFAGSSTKDNIRIRSARQLYNLATYYDTYYDVLGSITYSQTKDIDYSTYKWSTYFGDSKSSQSPIGVTANKPFNSTYDGGCYEIKGVSFETDNGFYIGMFGYNTGTINNVVLANQYSSSGTNYYVRRNNSVSRNQTQYTGVLAGYNTGTIKNCAVAGYYLSGNTATVHGYDATTIYVGGLVGFNSTTGTITASTADNPEITVNMYNATCYAGGFVGYNEGSINNTYALTHLASEVTGSAGLTNIAGFAGYSTGSIRNSYCATALTSSGDNSHSYLFTTNATSGSVSGSYYLYRGSYNYCNQLYPFTGNTAVSSGTNISYTEMKNRSSGSQAVRSLYHGLTNETTYPFKAIVTDSNGNLVHYGEWLTTPTLGTYGVFYWEKEDGGNNNGYHLTYIGREGEDIEINTTLCTQHDDGGVISEYGYGYYTLEGGDTVSISVTNASYGTVNTAAKSALEAQLPGLSFYPYTTTTDTSGSYLYLNSTDINGSITLTNTVNGTSTSDTFFVSPFFANALAMKVDSATYAKYNSQFLTTSEYGSRANLTTNGVPGSSSNPYEIRSVQQLQYINWNSSDANADSLVSTSNYKTFNYLMSTSSTSGTSAQTKSNAGYSQNSNLVFNMSHDLNASSYTGFTPIAGQTTSSSNVGSSGYNSILYAWFGGAFNGQSYKIQELNIESDAYTVGLFGVTVDADLQNIILYSKNASNRAYIKRTSSYTDGDGNVHLGEDGAYSIGGLVGVAYQYTSSGTGTGTGTGGTSTGNSIKNCAIAGYKIIDNSTNRLTLGEANIGGLVGVSNVNIDRSSAVVDIELNCEHKGTDGKFTAATYGNFIRVGGLVGGLRYKVTNSYSGGSISVTNQNLLNETYVKTSSLGNDSQYNNSYAPSYTNYIANNSEYKASVGYSTHIYLAGIAGSGFSQNYMNFTGSTSLIEGTPQVENSYTYIDFPTMTGTIRSITMITSVADRFSQSGANASITNSYYLETSADFNTDSLPAYYFSNSSSSAKNSTSYLDQMKNGSAAWCAHIINNSNNASSQLSGTPLTKTYDELASKDMISTLGSSFNSVTTSENERGKYSFNAGTTQLDSKDYPFPTVIKEQTNNVHYGRWPLNTAYFEEGNVSLDIFENMTSDEYAYKNVVLKKNNKDVYNLKFELRNNGSTDNPIAEIAKQIDKDGNEVDYITNDDGDYVVKIKALRTGNVNLYAVYDADVSTHLDDDVFCSINITANLTLTTSQSEITIGSGVTDTNTKLTLTSTNNSQNEFTNDKNVEWTATSSKVGNNANNNDAVNDLVLSGSKPKSLKMTGTGYNGNVSVIAKYNYHGNTYEAGTSIRVLSPSVLGLAVKKDSSYVYQTATITSEAGEVKGTDVTYPTDTSPTNTNSYYLYVQNNKDYDLLSKTKTIQVYDSTDTSLTNPRNDVISNISTSMTSSDDNGYRCLPFDLYYTGSTENSLTNQILKVTVTDGNTSYVYVVSGVTVKPVEGRVVTVENNINVAQTIELTYGTEYKGDLTTITSGNFTYTLEGDVTMDDGTVFTGSKEQVNSLIADKSAVLHANYIKNYKLKFVTIDQDGNEVELSPTSSNITVNSKTTSINVPYFAHDTSYSLVGWYSEATSSGAEVISVSEDQGTGTVTNTLDVEVLVNLLDSSTSTDGYVKLYANWKHKESHYAYYKTDEMKRGTSELKNYLITYKDSYGTVYALTAEYVDNDQNSLKATVISVSTDESTGTQYINNPDDKIIWTYNYNKQQKLYNKATSNYLKRRDWSLQLDNEENTDWRYENKELYSSSNRLTYYIYYSGSSFKLTNLNYYQKQLTVYGYEAQDIYAETFVYNTTATNVNDVELPLDDSYESAQQPVAEPNETVEPTATPDSTTEPIETTIPDNKENEEETTE